MIDTVMHENLKWMLFNQNHAGTKKASLAARSIIAKVTASL